MSHTPIDTAKELAQIAAQNAPEFRFGSAEIVGASAKHAHLFSIQESAVALTETVAKAGLAFGAIAPVVGAGYGLMGALGITLHNVVSGSKKGGREV